jgi:hypothetical protein
MGMFVREYDNTQGKNLLPEGTRAIIARTPGFVNQAGPLIFFVC